MDSSKETIHELLMLKLAGSLSEADEQLVNAMIEQEPGVRAQWEAIQAEFAAPGMKEALENFDTAEFLAGVKSAIAQRRQGKIIRLRKALLWASAITGISLSAYFLLQQRTPVARQEPAVAAAATSDASKNIHLKLANGKIVDLSGAGKVQSIDAGDVTLNQSSNTLTYTAKGNNTGTSSLVVPPGKDFTIRLADGSSVRLNSGTVLHFPFSFAGPTREITINGEAYLKVAPNTRQPFIVHTPRSTVQVLGTEFNVNSYDSGKVTVSLVKGAVKMQAGDKDVTLKPGYQASFTDGKGTRVSTFDESETLSWLKGSYVFRNASLGQIMPILERWYGVKIVLDNKTVADKIFTGQVNKTDSINAFLDMLKIIRDADYYYQGDVIHIK